MTVYAKKLTATQRETLEHFERISGFEPLGQDDFDAGTLTYEELCERNVKWIEGMAGDAVLALSPNAEAQPPKSR